MEAYHSTEFMLEELSKNGWNKEIIPKGFILMPNSYIGTGRIIVWNTENQLRLLDIDVTFSKPQFMMNYCKECGVQITFIESAQMEYYKDKTEIETGHFGNFVYVNNVCIPWFKRYTPNQRIKALTIMLGDDFLKEKNIFLSEEDWSKLARGINNRNISQPALSVILKQIRETAIDDELFDLYFKTKSLEAFLLLWDCAIKNEKNDLKRITHKSHVAVKEALTVIYKEYLSPPIITDLAKRIGIDKKTLQFAFKEIVGLSIHNYIKTLKMQKALLLLGNDNMTIENISKEVGYQSKIHFYKAFKDCFDCTPSQMRRK